MSHFDLDHILADMEETLARIPDEMDVHWSIRPKIRAARNAVSRALFYLLDADELQRERRT